MIWTRGAIKADDALQISVQDRALEHGLGLFETLRTWNGRPALLPRHLDRLRRSADELRIPLDPRDLPSADDVRALLAANGQAGDAMIRITLSGGTSETAGSTLWMRSAPLPPPTPTAGYRLGPAAPARNDKLAGYKSLNYWPYRLAHQDARAKGGDECLLIGPGDEVLEGSRTNVFFVVDGKLVTPPADGRIVPGIMRGLVIERARALGIGVEQTCLSHSEAWNQSTEFFLTNAVRGIIPVGWWSRAAFSVPGEITQTLRDDLAAWLESGGTS